MLFDNSESDSEVDLKIDNNYASNYNNWRQKEELNKLKTKYGEQTLKLDDDSSSSDSEDDGKEIPGELEKDFFKTLASLKNKDPKIYDKNFEFFQDVSDKVKKKLKSKEQPLFIKDYERKMILENSEELNEGEPDNLSESQTYVEEQTKLKKNLKDALLNSMNENDDDEWGGMFKIRQKSDQEHKQEEEDYKEWLLGHKGEINDKEAESDLKPLKDYWSSPNLEDGEKFLRDYILNKRFLETEDENHIPTYEEIIHDSDDGLSEDEKVVEKQEEFEHKYNYRFEEPDQEFIKRYPRTMESSLRRQDDRRKIKRAEIKERKQKEKKQKMEEIKQMQVLKKKEIEEKISKLKEITGNTDIQFNNEDVDGDFDPASHDKRMQELFNDDFYQGAEEEQKPEFPELDEELELENWEKFKDKENGNTENDTQEQEPHCEDGDFNMDCDFNPETLHNELIDNTRNKKKRKRKSKFAKVVSETKPVFDPSDKTYQEYLDEYYKLDCEDIIGDIPCRFKYRQVVPNNFGLSVEEILLAKDRELNRWCSLKKAVQYRPENVEKYDVIAFEKKARNDPLKKKILPSLFAEEDAVKVKEDVSGNRENSSNLKSENGNGTVIKNNKMKSVQGLPDIKDDVSQNQSSNEKEDTPSWETIQNADETLIAMENNAKMKKILKNKNVMMMDKNHAKKKKKRKSSMTNMEVKVEKKLKLNSTASTSTQVHQIFEKKPKHEQNIVSDKKGLKRKHSQLKSKKKYKQGNATVSKLGSEELKISDARLLAYGLKPKRFKNKIKYGQKNRCQHKE